MKILILGSGGREHSIAKKLNESTMVVRLYCAPGNPGIGEIAENLNIAINDFEAIKCFCIDHEIDYVIVGPEDPLINGIKNYLNDYGIKVFGPDKNAARIEGSKAFSKLLMKKNKIPTAEFENFKNYQNAIDYLETKKAPIVVKASGNALGKGAVICNTISEAKDIVRQMMVDKIFGEAGDEIVIEEFMRGEEASLFVVCDETNYKIMVPAQDHKAIYDGDKGPNTGGMGSYAPAPVITNELMLRIENEIIIPTLDGMRNENSTFTGLLFIGLMITSEGPKVIEYNCRFGDPETQAVLPMLDCDLAKLLFSACNNELKDNTLIPVKEGFAVCLVSASEGYPGNYKKGYEIKFANDFDYKKLIQAGTKMLNNKLSTNGGRVLGIVATGKTLIEAKESSYNEMRKVSFEGNYYRSDIADKGIRYFE
ncbi:MAG: phosphoribosylamine--glycine ligase [Candidatus Delongbacteria bacterium]|nr:phosphoribosylamine--glycine ligase [Candidatus Delongbacteria bacterium]MBN2833764.1 phosphoribosylamine--glycine ligase [Candidatus Delongbacteria bacterium]